MLTIDVNLLNNPVLITCPTQRLPSEQREYDHLTGYVLLNSDRRRCIGGVRVVWAVTVEQARIVRAAAGRHGAQVHHEDEEQDDAVGIGEGGGKSRGLWSGKESRRQKGKGKAKKGEGKWGEKVVIDEYEVDVVGPMYFEAGETRLEFGISVRPEIACSRVTRFDRIQHTLHGSILAAPPGYESLFPASSLPSKYEERSVDSGRRDSTVTSCATSGRRSSSTPSSAPSMYDGDAPPYEASLHGYSNPDESSTNIPLRPDSAVARCQHSVGAVDTGPGLLARWKNRFFPTRGPPSAAGSGSSGESTGVDRSATDQADGVLARCQRVVLLWSLDISGEYNWTHSQTVPKLGGAGVNLAISSEATDWCKSLKIQLVLGGAVTGTVHLTDIPEDMTIHAITFDLTQTTLAPREFPASAAGDDGSEREPERPSVVDEWTLAEQGVVPASKLAGRKLHSPPIAVKGKKGSFSSAVTFDLWRHGHTAYSSPAPKQGSPLHSSVPSTDLLIRLPGRLPSPLLGASSTNDHPGHPPLPPCPPSPATRSSLCAQVLISHEWSFTIHFSQLGTDADGEPLTAEHYAVKTAPKGTEPRTLEGAVRTWKLAKGVVVGSDLAISPGMVAPTYANSSDVEDNPTGTETDRGESLHPERSARPARPEIDIGIGNAKSHRVTRRPGQPATPCKRESMISDWHNNKSISLPQRRSHIMGNWTFLRAVQRDEREMRREVGAHWDETGGMCACFRDHGEGPMKSRGDEGGSGRAAVVKTSQGS